MAALLINRSQKSREDPLAQTVWFAQEQALSRAHAIPQAAAELARIESESEWAHLLVARGARRTERDGASPALASARVPALASARVPPAARRRGVGTGWVELASGASKRAPR